MGKTALVIIVENSEELEVVAPIDTLRRGGVENIYAHAHTFKVEVTVAGLNSAGTISSRNQVIIGAEKSLDDALAQAPFDAIILPGGKIGSEEYVESEVIGRILREQDKAGGLIAGICASPNAFWKFDIGLGKAITSYPTSKERMMAGNKYEYKDDRVVVDGNLITSRGPGTALEWSMAILEWLVGAEKAEEVGKAMLYK